ncbi:MAG: AI-2E family transporter [Persicimonas sp.]
MGAEDRHTDADQMDRGGQWRFSGFTRRAASVIAMLVLTVGIIILTWQAIPVLLAVFWGILLAVFLRGPSNWIADRAGIAPLAALALFSGALLAVGVGVGWLFAPTVAEQANEIVDTIPESFEQVRRTVEETSWGKRLVERAPGPGEIGEQVGWQNIGGAFTNVAGALTNLVFVFFVGVYLAIDPHTYKRGAVRLVPVHYRERAEQIIDVVSHQLGWWLIGQLGSMLTVGVLSAIGLWLLGIPLALVLGLIGGLFAFVPILGPIAAFIPAALVALLVSPVHVLYVAALYLGVQTIEGYLVTPLIQERTVSLPPALVIISQVLAGVLLGLIGVIVATPLVVVIIAIINLVYVEDILGDSTPYSEKSRD